MNIPAWAFWLLLCSVFVGIFLMIFVYFFTRKKVKNIQKNFEEEIPESEKESSLKAFESQNHLKLLDNLKEKTVNALGDAEMLMIINTFIRNSFKTFTVINNTSDYEIQSIISLAKGSQVKLGEKYDFALVFENEKTFEVIKDVYNSLQPNGLILVVNAPKRSQYTKKVIYECKILSYRHEFEAIGNGVVWIAK